MLKSSLSAQSPKQLKIPEVYYASVIYVIVNKKEVKEAAGDFRVGGDFYEALDALVKDLMKKAQKRAKENGRKTLQPYDL